MGDYKSVDEYAEEDRGRAPEPTPELTAADLAAALDAAKKRGQRKLSLEERVSALERIAGLEAVRDVADLAAEAAEREKAAR